MLPDRVSNPGPLTYESGALPIALRDPAPDEVNDKKKCEKKIRFFSILIRLLFKQSTFSALHVYINPFLLNCCSPRMLIYLYLHLNLYCHILYGKSEIKNI